VTGVSRLAGSDRISTAVAVSHSSFPIGGAGAVVLAKADDYPDALVGAPLAAAKNAPLLLTEGSTLATATSTEISRVLAAGGTVYILGGVGAIPAAVATQLTGAGYQVVRYAGADRFATAVAVAGALDSPGTVLLASGENYPDALAAGPAAAHVHGAVLLTDGNVMPAATKDYLAKATTVYAIGGPAATADPAATAVVGGDRYETAAAVATKFFSAPAAAGIATGLSFPDALSGGAQLALLGGPLLLASQGSVPFATANYLTQTPTITDVRVYGGAAVLGDSVVTQLESIEASA
jgi:putative cell wall-binding protein